MTRPSWDERIERAEELGGTYAFAANLLGFYRAVAGFQKKLQATLCGAALPPGGEFRERLDVHLLLPAFPLLLSLVEREGPPPLADAARKLGEKGEEGWRRLLLGYWQRSEPRAYAPEMFFALASLQPYAELLASQAAVPERPGRPTCPFCGEEPVVGVLRPEGHGARRSLICSLCSTEWDYVRMACPACGESRAEALAVYTAEQFEHVRVEGCESCKTYMKTVDLSKNGLAIPVVDELATLPLSLWAEEKGYRKLQPNLLGT